ncbi:MAG: InlB B-repeat-containing protein [Prevotellaceae bacterium]|nr:InlB B-repeat-containing protein [Candidatus Faecinaster equi]
MAEQFIGSFFGNTAGTKPKFRVCCDLQYTQEDTSTENNKGFFYQKRYYIEVTVAGTTERSVSIDWGPDWIKIKNAGIYADTGWIDIGWVAKNTSFNVSCAGVYKIDNVEYRSSLSHPHTAKPEMYTISFNGNGGTDVPSSITFEKNTPVKLPDAKPYATGYHFIQWNSQEDGSGVNYAPGSTYNLNASVVLYAMWEIKKVKVIFHKNDGTSTKEEKEFTYGIKGQKFPDLNWKRTEYDLTGLTKTADGKTVDYELGYAVTDSWINSQPLTLDLYGFWVLDTVSFTGKVKMDGVQHDITNVFVKADGVQHQAVAIFVKADGTWKKS